MKDKFDILIDILEKSLKRNGNQELTVEHLLNLMKIVTRVSEKQEDKHETYMDSVRNECLR